MPSTTPRRPSRPKRWVSSNGKISRAISISLNALRPIKGGVRVLGVPRHRRMRSRGSRPRARTSTERTRIGLPLRDILIRRSERRRMHQQRRWRTGAATTSSTRILNGAGGDRKAAVSNRCYCNRCNRCNAYSRDPSNQNDKLPWPKGEPTDVSSSREMIPSMNPTRRDG